MRHSNLEDDRRRCIQSRLASVAPMEQEYVPRVVKEFEGPCWNLN